MNIYLLKRDERPTHHNAPYHPVIVCTKRDVAKWQAGDSRHHTWIWEQAPCDPHHGLLLVRWNGLDIDYGHLVKAITLPDGDRRAFDHEHSHPETWALFRGAVWWSHLKMPEHLVERGTIYPPDAFTQARVLEDARTDFTYRGKDRHIERPAFWPDPEPNEKWGARFPASGTGERLREAHKPDGPVPKADA